MPTKNNPFKKFNTLNSLSRTASSLGWLVLLSGFLLISNPTESKAAVAYSFEAPDTTLGASTGVEVIKHAGGIWVATGGGVNFTFDNGATWLLYDSSNGLPSDNLSSILSQGSRLWVGANYTEIVNSTPTSLSDGLYFTDDLGDSWNRYDFTTIPVDKIYGVSRQIFDIAGHYDPADNDDWIFFSAFAGGLVASRDGGTSWRRIYPSVSDSVSFNDPQQTIPSERMRYFSCATDTSHGDTLLLWGGTAEGIFQYTYIVPREKQYTKIVNQIAFCDECTDPEGSYVFIAGNTGFTRGLKTGRPFVSRFQIDGLPSDHVTAVTDFRGRVFVGTANTAGTSSTGLAYSDDRGDSFTPDITFNSTYAVGANSNIIRDFEPIGERLYMAAEEAGLFVSDDTGQSWSRIFVDSSNMTSANRRNVVFSLEGIGDTLRVGTDSGLVQLFLDPAGVIDSSRFYVFAESSTSAGRVTRIRTQSFYDSTGTVLDSTAIWTVNQRITVNGTPMVGRSVDRGQTWYHVRIGQGVADLSRDIDFLEDTVVIVGVGGMYKYFEFPQTNDAPFGPITISDSTNVDNLNSNLITTVAISGDTIYYGSNNGFAATNNRGRRHKIHRVNIDSLAADLVVQSTQENASPLLDGITGNFIPAMEVQYIDSGAAIIWTSCRPTFGGFSGIAVGAQIRLIDTTATPDDTIYTRQWLSQYDQFAWNFSFNGDTAFAATDSGLIFTVDTGFTWDTVQFIDTAGNTIYDSGRPVFGVSAIDSFLWVGAEDRIIRLRLSDFEAEGFYVIDSNTEKSEVYAFPVPYSNVQDVGGGITFRFALDKDASVTIEVYDFGMNLVRRVIDNQFFTAGFYPTVTQSVQWDVLNGKGNQLAVGIYYFKVELSTGETRWGKLAVIP